MLVPFSWLRDFAPFDLTARAMADTLDDLGMVVEGMETIGEGLEGVVVARVLEIGAIPRADRIRRVLVDAGAPDPVQVVCGAWNFETGDTVALATVGAVLPGDFAIARRKMKGVVSDGMLCSPTELRLGDDGDGILILPSGLAPGAPLAEALGITRDVVYDLAIEGNRPDAMSIAGVARDAAARLRLPFAIPTPPVTGGAGAVAGAAGVAGAVAGGAGAGIDAAVSVGGAGASAGGPAVGGAAGAPLGGAPAGSAIGVEVESPDLCPRFAAQVLSGVTMAESPAWLARRLVLAGMRPINSVVDASNYVMLELGQPTHPYDLDRLRGGGLRARAARPGETVETLDGVKRRLGEGAYPDCVICDGEDVAVGIAGIMGGASSEISASSRRVVLEAANFTAMAIARTSRRLGLRSEASARFERGVDPEGIDRAIDRFCELVALTSPDLQVVGNRVDVRALVTPPVRLALRTDRVNRLLGTSLGADQVSNYLSPLGFDAPVSGTGVLQVTVPSYRPDVTREIDLIEEVARHHGYANIARTVPNRPGVGRLTPYQRDRRRVRDVLAGTGASEAVCSSLLGPGDHARAGLPENGITAVDPLAREESVLRTSLLPGLLRSVAFNSDRRNRDLGLFEIGHVFRVPEWAAVGAAAESAVAVEAGIGGRGGRVGSELPDEREMVAVALAGAGLAGYGGGATGAMQVLRLLLDALRLESITFEASSPAGLHPTRSADVLVGGTRVGYVGEVDPDISSAWGIDARVGWLELDLGAVLHGPRRSIAAAPVSRFPSSDIDLAFTVDERTAAGAVQATLTEVGGELLERVSLFDVYRGPGVADGARSLAFRLRFCALDHTLTDAEVGELRARCVQAVETLHPARLRS
jgi:phenylalanyl-tRNA synthetase beta chain